MSLTFEWDEEMATGIEKIDAQHKDFLELGKKAEELMKDKNLSENDVTGLLDSINGFFELHFKEEEKVMDEIHYKRVTPHKESHQQILSKLKSINLDGIKEDPLMVIIEIKTFIQDIIWDHLFENDKDLGREYRRYQKLFKHMEQSKQEERAENEKKFGVIIKEDNMTIAYLMWDQTYKGNAILVNKEKRASLLKLSALESSTFMRDLFELMRAIQKTFGPDDIELLTISDVDKQFCIHVVPKYKDDPEYGNMYSSHPDFERWPREEYEKLAAEILKNY